MDSVLGCDEQASRSQDAPKVKKYATTGDSKNRFLVFQVLTGINIREPRLFFSGKQWIIALLQGPDDRPTKAECTTAHKTNVRQRTKEVTNPLFLDYTRER